MTPHLLTITNAVSKVRQRLARTFTDPIVEQALAEIERACEDAWRESRGDEIGEGDDGEREG